MDNKTLAIIGFVLALVLGGLPGLIVSAIALKNMNRSGEVDGKGFAIAGLVIGIIEIALIVLAIVCGGAEAICVALSGETVTYTY